MLVTDFKSVNKEETGKLLSELKKHSPILYRIITNKKLIKTHVFHSIISNSYLLMIHLVSDSYAIELAAQYRFPRGFPIIWTAKDGFRYYGFHPKFSNDRKQTNNITEFQGTELNMMLKFSGFLAQVIVWQDDRHVYWTSTSKNSVSNEFSKNANSIISKFMTDKTVNELAKRQLYFCGEVMSKNDMTHGARVLTEGFVCTCVGRVQTDPLADRIMDHMSMHQLCMELNIPVAEIISSTEPLRIGQELAVMRDHMTMSKFRDWLLKCKCTIHHGSVMHEDILGDILEGLVIWITGTSGTTTIKYKFPKYTVRTFGLREFNGSFMSSSYLRHIDSYLDYWVTTSEGKTYWKKWLLAAAMVQNTMIIKDDPAAKHIVLAELVDSLDDSKLDELSQQYGLTGQSSQPTQPVQSAQPAQPTTVIVIVGPIGSGKTTYGRHLEATLPNCRHLDGDNLYGAPAKLTLSLGKERSPATLSEIIHIILDGKTPIISCGGGVLFSQTGSLILKDYITRLGLELNMIVCIPCPIDNLSSYYQKWTVHDIIKHRLATGQWTTAKTPKIFIDEIQQLSERNVRYARDLCKLADHVHSWNWTDDASGLDAKLHRPLSYPVLLYRQLRILVSVPDLPGSDMFCGHITIDFSDDYLPVRTELINKVRSEIKMKKITGQSVRYHGFHFISIDQDYAMWITGLMSDLTRPWETLHITVNPGKHEAAVMGDACQQFRMDPNNISLSVALKRKQGKKGQKEPSSFHYTDPKIIPVDIEILDLVYV